MPNDFLVSPSDFVANLRFTPERELFARLLADPSLARSAESLRRANEEDANRRRLLANSLRVTERIMPSLMNRVAAVQEATQTVGLEVETYIYNSPHQQASCMYFENGPVFLLISSGLYSAMTEQELSFVIGHEFGHVVYEHHLLPARAILNTRGACNSTQALSLMAWARRAEISADRIGLLCCQDIDVAAKALIKLSCGLRDDMIEFDLPGYVEQMSDIEAISQTVRAVEDFYSTHPFNPIRVVALSRVWESGVVPGSPLNATVVHSSDEIDAGIDQLLRFMDPDAAAIENGNVLECLVWGGYWVAASDGQVDRVEVDSLQESTNPQLASAAAIAIKQSKEPLVFIQQRFHESAKQCRQLPPHQRHAMIQRMIAVAKANMSVASEEMVTLREICKALDVNPAFPEKILWQYEDFVFANYGTGT